ncbi:hypothetical protein GN157_08990 [Flavobacterium rakeshii]|uniref:Immunity protein 22 n=1 Tax=Flavobacterium rakeshii TaxID=1038845 RepID=A0A6N8HC97_9FLAO|nr:immunity 22 family protein [Flavobacterium rakeshii]MUV03842.1 hypothetical protein [Flavobacterium rakeshii]
MEEENKVSVWVGWLNNQEQFKNYIKVDYNDDGDMVSDFMSDFDIEYYDEQFQEALFNISGVKSDIFKDFSYIENFFINIPAQDFSVLNSFILLYNFNFTAEVKNTDNFNFLGTFNYR